MLKALTEASSYAGFENEVRSIISNTIAPFADSIKTDNMGNLIARKKGKLSKKSVVISCHIDEAGFIISDITDDGYLRFKPIGGIQPESMISKHVKINNILGVISFKAIHLTTRQEREKDFKFKDLLIDIGAKSRRMAEKYVKTGDVGGFVSEYREFGDNLIKAKALDSRACCSVLTELLMNEYNADITAVFAAHGTLENRGLSVAAKNINADFALNINAHNCGDNIALGGGAVLPTAFSNGLPGSQLIKKLSGIADKNDIKLQYCASRERGGCIEFGGADGVDIIIPIKLENSPSNIMSKDDYGYCKNLLNAFLSEL